MRESLRNHKERLKKVHLPISRGCPGFTIAIFKESVAKSIPITLPADQATYCSKQTKTRATANMMPHSHTVITKYSLTEIEESERDRIDAVGKEIFHCLTTGNDQSIVLEHVPNKTRLSHNSILRLSYSGKLLLQSCTPAKWGWLGFGENAQPLQLHFEKSRIILKYNYPILALPIHPRNIL